MKSFGGADLRRILLRFAYHESGLEVPEPVFLLEPGGVLGICPGGRLGEDSDPLGQRLPRLLGEIRDHALDLLVVRS